MADDGDADRARGRRGFSPSIIAADADDPEEAARQRGVALSLSPELAEIDEESVGSVERVVDRLPTHLRATVFRRRRPLRLSMLVGPSKCPGGRRRARRTSG